MVSKICCVLPGRSMESRGRKKAKSTMIIAATRICMVMKLVQGRAGCSAWTWKIPRIQLPRPARYLLNRTVSQVSDSGIQQLEQDLQNDGGGWHKKADQPGRQG